MKKIVINACYGGFGLSDEAMVRYCELKGITVYPEKEKDAWGHTSYYLKLPENRKKIATMSSLILTSNETTRRWCKLLRNSVKMLTEDIQTSR